MDIKENLKLNYKLGSYFFLIPKSNGWVLMRSGSYRIVMDSDNNTKEELEQFVKEHREYNGVVIIRRFGLIANTIVLGLCIANLFIHSSLLSYFNFGAIMILLPMLILINHIGLNNHDLYKKVLDEDISYYGKVLAKEDKPKRKKSTRAKRERKKSSEIQE